MTRSRFVAYEDECAIIEGGVLKFYLTLSDSDKSKISYEPMTEEEIIRTNYLDNQTLAQVMGKI